jgi:hypothetical protein
MEPLLGSGQRETMELLLEAVFCTAPLRGYTHITRQTELSFVRGIRVEAGSNTSNVTLRVVGGDGKGTQCLGV